MSASWERSVPNWERKSQERDIECERRRGGQIGKVNFETFSSRPTVAKKPSRIGSKSNEGDAFLRIGNADGTEASGAVVKL